MKNDIINMIHIYKSLYESTHINEKLHNISNNLLELIKNYSMYYKSYCETNEMTFYKIYSGWQFDTNSNEFVKNNYTTDERFYNICLWFDYGNHEQDSDYGSLVYDKKKDKNNVYIKINGILYIEKRNDMIMHNTLLHELENVYDLCIKPKNANNMLYDNIKYNCMKDFAETIETNFIYKELINKYGFEYTDSIVKQASYILYKLTFSEQYGFINGVYAHINSAIKNLKTIKENSFNNFDYKIQNILMSIVNDYKQSKTNSYIIALLFMCELDDLYNLKQLYRIYKEQLSLYELCYKDKRLFYVYRLVAYYMYRHRTDFIQYSKKKLSTNKAFEILNSDDINDYMYLFLVLSDNIIGNIKQFIHKIQKILQKELIEKTNFIKEYQNCTNCIFNYMIYRYDETLK